MMEADHAVQRLLQVLPRDVRVKILKGLIRDHSIGEIARNLGCSTITVERWLRGEFPNDGEMSKILVLALRSYETIGILNKFFDEFELLFERLNLLEKQRKMDILLEGLDEKSRWIVQYLTIKKYADIRELADLIEAPIDMEVILRLRKVINPRAEEILGEPLANFERCKIDPITGQRVLFNWWLSASLIKSLDYYDALLDVFDEGNHLRVVVHLPSRDEKDLKIRMKGKNLVISAKDYHQEVPLPVPIDGITEEAYHNGVLEVKLKKAV